MATTDVDVGWVCRKMDFSFGFGFGFAMVTLHLSKASLKRLSNPSIYLVPSFIFVRLLLINLYKFLPLVFL